MASNNSALQFPLNRNNIQDKAKSVIEFYFMFLFSILFFAVPVIGSANRAIDFSSSNLPIVMISTEGKTIQNKERIVADMAIICNDNNERNDISDPPNNYNGKIEIALHGQSSLAFPKKSFRVETLDSLGENLNVSLLGMPKENDWILYAPYSDKTLMRNVLCYTLASEISGYAPRARFCELVLNDHYHGVYVLIEKIKRDKNRVNITKMSRDDIAEPGISGGYIFKKDSMDEDDHIIKLDRGLALIIIEPKKDEIAEEQTQWLLKHLNEFEDVLYSKSPLDDYIDLNSFVENYLMVEFAKNIDGFCLSTFFYKDRNSKIVAAPIWDYNLSFGNADYNDGWTPVGWFLPIVSSWDKNWWGQLIAYQEFTDFCKVRWKELRAHQLTVPHIFSMIDDWTKVLKEAQQRNFTLYPILGEYVWPNPGYPQSGSYGYDAPKEGAPVTWEEEIAFMKDFIQKRIKWIDTMYGFDIGEVTIKELNEMLCTMQQNYPNPFNTRTTISYTLIDDDYVQLIVYDVTGRTLKTIVDKFQSAGEYKIVFDASDLASGLYIYQLKTGAFEQSRKMVAMK